MKKIAILFGGKSVEHAVSINSAKNVFQYMDRSKFSPILIYISRSGLWKMVSDFSEAKNGGGEDISIQMAPEISITCNGSKMEIDLFFPLVHGTNGEDGSLQGMLNALDFPYIGCGILGSAVNMSKLTTKKILKSSGLPVNKFISFHRSERKKITFAEVERTLGLPFMVKSANLGSSVGINKVNKASEFDFAVEEAFKFDHRLIFEEFVKGREIECAVLGNESPEASNPGEIIIAGNYEFYDFKAKYVDADAVSIKVPAVLDKETTLKIREVCTKAYVALECEDFARVDLFVTDDNDIYVNEINTIPGFTNSSMFPMMWKERGISFENLITRLIELAFNRHELLKTNNTDYFSELDN